MDREFFFLRTVERCFGNVIGQLKFIMAALIMELERQGVAALISRIGNFWWRRRVDD